MGGLLKTPGKILLILHPDCEKYATVKHRDIITVRQL